MRATFIAADNPSHGDVNTSFYRILIPAKYLRKAGHEISSQLCPVAARPQGRADMINYSSLAEVVLVERIISPEMVRMLRLAGVKRIILTFDDNYRLMPEEFQSMQNWGHYGLLNDFLSALPLVDLVIVPSAKLKSDFIGLNGNIKVVPNYLDVDHYQGLRRTEDKTLGWGGTVQHKISWQKSGIVRDLKNVLKRQPDWKLLIFGPAPVEILREAEVPFEFVEQVYFDDWPKAVARFTIGLAPLFGEYDRRRSNLKVVEYGALHIPFVATDYEPYRNGSNGGFLVGTGFWSPSLEELMENEALRNELGEVGYEWAQQFMMPAGAQRYEDLLWG